MELVSKLFFLAKQNNHLIKHRSAGKEINGFIELRCLWMELGLWMAQFCLENTFHLFILNRGKGMTEFYIVKTL